MNVRTLLMASVIVCFAACKGENSGKSRGPIVLGDSSTIVTESDAAALQDEIPDLKPVIAINDENTINVSADDTAVTSVAPASPAAPAPAAPAASGLNVPFKEITLSIPGITTRSFGKPDLQKARGATYELTGGNLAGATLRTSGGTVTKVSQRYETVVALKDGSKTLPLEQLGKYTSGWQVLNGSGNYSLAGLEPAKLGFKPATPAAIRNATQQAARKKRLSQKETADWLAEAKDVRAANTAPATVLLRSVSWRIEGKGFNKELRIDVPLP